jgi:hypothetical protein
MSTEAEEEVAVAAGNMCCASCGTAAVDDIKLKNCDGGCDLVKYCSDTCEANHRPQHEKMCKKRLAELRDDNLFTQPDESHMGECSICCLPLPIDPSKSTFMSCCSKYICNGCDYANQVREYEAGLEPRCAFCREPAPKSKEESEKRIMKRIKKNCPVAMCHMGKKRYHAGDYDKAFVYFTTAAELGDAGAHYNLSCLYRDSEGVEKDMKKLVYHLEEAAIAGHPKARFYLGIHELKNGRLERARKHWIIAANLGHDQSLKGLKDLYAEGYASKEEYANALRAYQAAVDATKSEERAREGESGRR